jgi:hypothetical protein
MRRDGIVIDADVADCMNPEWQPLLNLASELVEDFMWMHVVETGDGRRLHAYKHYWTRRYIHLDGTGAAFLYRHDGRYQQVDAYWLLDTVVERTPAIPWVEEHDLQLGGE